jgi:hypothetical protein
LLTVAGLLDPLEPEQQWLVDLVAEGYDADGQWPIFDYLEGKFDGQHKDAWETLYSLPRAGQWTYGAAWWVGMNQPYKPPAEMGIELTVLGMHHTSALKDRVSIFLETLRYMIEVQRGVPPLRREPRRLELDSKTVRVMLNAGRHRPLLPEEVARIPTLWKHEPATMVGGEVRDPQGVWTYAVPRAVLEYEGVSTIEEYIDRLEALTAFPSTPLAETTPSPLSLVSALDYLDMSWRAAHGNPLFSYPSAERAAKLAYPAATKDELDSRLTALGEILRSANTTVRGNASRLARATHEKPLAPLNDFLMRQAALDPTRIAAAVTTLEAALSVRDAAQHTEAGGREVMALTQEFNLAHPISDPSEAWAVIASRVVSAITAIREEIGANL